MAISVKIFITALFVMGLMSCGSGKKSGRPELMLTSYSYDLGIVKKDSLYKGSSIIINSGEGELVIDNVSAGCGCTSVEVNKNRLEPGDTTLLKFTYDTYGKIGDQTENIVIAANTDSLVYVFKVLASVVESK